MSTKHTLVSNEQHIVKGVNTHKCMNYPNENKGANIFCSTFWILMISSSSNVNGSFVQAVNSFTWIQSHIKHVYACRSSTKHVCTGYLRKHISININKFCYWSFKIPALNCHSPNRTGEEHIQRTVYPSPSYCYLLVQGSVPDSSRLWARVCVLEKGNQWSADYHMGRIYMWPYSLQC